MGMVAHSNTPAAKKQAIGVYRQLSATPPNITQNRQDKTPERISPGSATDHEILARTSRYRAFGKLLWKQKKDASLNIKCFTETSSSTVIPEQFYQDLMGRLAMHCELLGEYHCPSIPIIQSRYPKVTQLTNPVAIMIQRLCN